MNLVDVPEPDEITADWWEATRSHVLKVQKCTACEHLQFPPKAVCVSCSSMESLTLIEASGRATVDSYTNIFRGPRPDVEVPYTVARVRLAEGPLMLTQLIGGTDWTIGDEVELDWADLEDGRSLPVFGTKK